MCSLHNLYSQFTSCITSISHNKMNIQIPVYNVQHWETIVFKILNAVM